MDRTDPSTISTLSRVHEADRYAAWKIHPPTPRWQLVRVRWRSSENLRLDDFECCQQIHCCAWRVENQHVATL